MSAPVRGDEYDNDGPLRYAPKRTRRSEHHQKLRGTAKEAAIASPSEPPWKQKTQRGVFLGDMAIAELRSQLPLSDEIPEPPFAATSVPRRYWVRRSISVILLIGIGVVGYLWGFASPPQLAVLASDTADLVPQPAAVSHKTSKLDSELAATQQSASRLAGSAGSPRRGATDSGTSAGAAQYAVLTKQTPSLATVMSSPSSTVRPPSSSPPSSSEASVTQLNGPPSRDPTSAQAPSELHVESAPTPAKSRPRRLDATEIAVMMKSGAEFMANGNVGAARKIFEAAAQVGDPAAAFALAETYDPLVLARLGTKGGISPDLALASHWYNQAKNLGSPAAPTRLEMLARLTQ